MDDLSFLTPLILGSIILPLLTWFARNMYDSWQLKGIYISKFSGTGEAIYLEPATEYEDATIPYGIVIRVVNITEQIHAIENVMIIWKNVHSDLVPELKILWEKEASVTIQPLFNFNSEAGELAPLPIVLKGKGEEIHLRVYGRLKFYKKSGLFKYKSFNPKKELLEDTINFLQNLRIGNNTKVIVKISGKSRSLPVKI